MEYHNSDLDDKCDVNILYWKLLMRLEHLWNMFFIERLLIRIGRPQSEIISISFDMITYTLPFWTHQDTLLPLRNDCEWLVSDARPLSFSFVTSLTDGAFFRSSLLVFPRVASCVKSC